MVNTKTKMIFVILAVTAFLFIVGCDNGDPPILCWGERTHATPKCCQPGDLDMDCDVDITDLYLLIEFLYHGGTPPNPNAADVDGDGEYTMSDVVCLIKYIFGDWPAPCSTEKLLTAPPC